MRIATRLVLILGGTVLLVMTAYMLISHRQRQDLLREGMVRDTEILGRSLQAVTNNALRDGRFTDLNEVLDILLRDEEVFASVVLDSAGSVVAGGAVDLACLLHALPEAVFAAQEARGWVQCDQRVYWVALPLRPPAAALVIAEREVLLNRSVAAALRRQLLLTLSLMAILAIALVLILHRTLSPALVEIMRGIRSLGEPDQRPQIRVSESAGELAHLAAAFNQLAEQLDQKQHELLSEAEERIALERRLREAEKFAVVGRVSGGLAHEVGAPLSVIGMRAQAIQRAPDTAASARQHAEAISTQVRHLTEFIQGLLHLEQRRGIVFDPLDLVQTVRDLMSELAPRARETDVELEAELPPAPVIVRGQETLLRHAIRNLIRNSFHALYQHAGERRIRIRMEVAEHEVCVIVEDTGPGIPPEHIERVFEPFFTTKQVGVGMGLGLPITRGIVEEHGGDLYLENLPENGVRAMLILPLESQGAPEAALPPPVSRRSGL